MQDKKEYQKNYYEKNKKRLRVKMLERYYRLKSDPSFLAKRNKYITGKLKELREEVISYYGGKCQCCGESNYEFLAIDHIKGGGKKHLASLPNPRIATWLRKNNYPKGFRVLCHNCNSSLGFYKYCPHKNG